MGNAWTRRRLFASPTGILRSRGKRAWTKFSHDFHISGLAPSEGSRAICTRRPVPDRNPAEGSRSLASCRPCERRGRFKTSAKTSRSPAPGSQPWKPTCDPCLSPLDCFARSRQNVHDRTRPVPQFRSAFLGGALALAAALFIVPGAEAGALQVSNRGAPERDGGRFLLGTAGGDGRNAALHVVRARGGASRRAFPEPDGPDQRVGRQLRGLDLQVPVSPVFHGE